MREQQMFQPDQGFRPKKWLPWTILAVVCFVVLLVFLARFIPDSPEAEAYASLAGKLTVPVLLVGYLGVRMFKHVRNIIENRRKSRKAD
jgi:multidrug transporter EmrE-like cation transporter